MSDLESTKRREFNPSRFNGVCRNLFGPVDHDQLCRELKSKLSEIAQQDKCRWNFNFETDTPLPGRFTWEKIASGSSTTPYQETTFFSDTNDFIQDVPEWQHCENSEDTLSLPVKFNQENCANISNIGKLTNCEVTPVRRKRRISLEERSKNIDNTKITDFFVKKRRSSEMKSCTSTAASTFFSEQSQSKRIR